MTGWSPLPPDKRVVLATGQIREWPWVFESWRQTDAEGRGQVWSTLRSPRDRSFSCHPRRLGGRALDARFAGSAHEAASVLYGSVSPDVRTVLVRAHGDNHSTEPATIVHGGELGRFFFAEFDWPVDRVQIDVEPRDLCSTGFPFVVNYSAERRHSDTEGVVLGEGVSPAGVRWRLRVWRPDDDGRQVRLETLGLGESWEGGGYGGPEPDRDQLVTLSLITGHAGAEQQIVGEVSACVAAVRLRLDDGRQIEAEILRTSGPGEDYWVAFAPQDHDVFSLVALGGAGETLVEHSREAQARVIREARARVTLQRDQGDPPP